MNNQNEASLIQPLREFIFNNKTIKPAIYLGLTFVIVCDFIIRNISKMADQPIYSLPLVILLIGLGVGIKERSYWAIYACAPLGFAAIFFVQKIVEMTSKIS